VTPIRRIMDRLVSVYDNGSLELREKTRLLAYCCLSGILAAIGFAVIRATVAFDVTNVVMGVLSLGFFGLSVMEPFTASSVLFKYALYSDFLIVALCMISLRATRLAVYSSAYVAGIVAIYLLRAKPAAPAGVAAAPIDLVTALVFVGLCGLLSWLVLSQLGATIRKAEQEAATNRERAERLSALLGALQSCLDSGGELVGSSGKAVESPNEIRKDLGDIEKTANRQDAGLAGARQWGAELSANSIALREGLDCHATSVSEAGAPVTAIATMDGIGRNTIDLMGRVNGGVRALDATKPGKAASGAAPADPTQKKRKE